MVNVNLIKEHKDGIILLMALVLPLGLPMLGIWKAIELYRKKERK
jgi:hypothetical protein